MAYDIVYPCDLTCDGSCPKACKDCSNCKGSKLTWEEDDDDDEA